MFNTKLFEEVWKSEKISKFDKCHKQCVDKIKLLHSKFKNELDDLFILMTKFDTESEKNHKKSLIKLPSEIIKLLDELDYMAQELCITRYFDIKDIIENGEEASDPVILSNIPEIKKKIKIKKSNNILCKDEFEWGMLFGKICALEWVLGSEWDSLDSNIVQIRNSNYI